MTFYATELAYVKRRFSACEKTDCCTGGNERVGILWDRHHVFVRLQRVTRLTITIIILSNELVQLRIYYLGQGAFQPRKADDTEGTRLAKLSRSGSQPKYRIRFTLPARGTSDIIKKELSYQLIYLTIIPRLRVGFEMVDHLISNKRQWNNCFIKNANKISRILPNFT